MGTHLRVIAESYGLEPEPGELIALVNTVHQLPPDEQRPFVHRWLTMMKKKQAAKNAGDASGCDVDNSGQGKVAAVEEGVKKKKQAVENAGDTSGRGADNSGQGKVAATEEGVKGKVAIFNKLANPNAQCAQSSKQSQSTPSVAPPSQLQAPTLLLELPTPLGTSSFNTSFFNDSVDELASTVQRLLLTDDFRLLHAGKQLEGGRALSDYGIGSSSSRAGNVSHIHVRRRLRGGSGVGGSQQAKKPRLSFASTPDEELQLVCKKGTEEHKVDIPLDANNFDLLLAKANTLLDRSTFPVEVVRHKDRYMLFAVHKRAGKTIGAGFCVRAFANKFVNGEASSEVTTFTTGEFGNFALAEDENFLKNHLGKYAVVQIDLAKANSPDPRGYALQLARAIVAAFRSHGDLLKEDWMSSNDKRYFEYLYNRTNAKEIADQRDFSTQIPFLVELLHRRNQEWRARAGVKEELDDVFMVVDEYDMGFNNAVSTYSTAEDERFKQIQNTLHDFIGSLVKADECTKHLKKLLIFGTLPHALDGKLTQLDIKVNPPELMHHFDMSAENYDALAAKNRLSPAQIEAGRSHYNGYQRFEEANGNLQRYYHAYSALNYISTGVIRSYWVDTDQVRMLDKLFKFPKAVDAFSTMMTGQYEDWARMGTRPTDGSATRYEQLKIDLSQLIRIEELMALKQLSGTKTNFEDNDQLRLFLTFLYYRGYFTQARYVEDRKRTPLLIPNEEIKSALKRHEINYFKSRYWCSGPTLISFLSALVKELRIAEETEDPRRLENLEREFDRTVAGLISEFITDRQVKVDLQERSIVAAIAGHLENSPGEEFRAITENCSPARVYRMEVHPTVADYLKHILTKKGQKGDLPKSGWVDLLVEVLGTDTLVKSEYKLWRLTEREAEMLPANDQEPRPADIEAKITEELKIALGQAATYRFEISREIKIIILSAHVVMLTPKHDVVRVVSRYHRVSREVWDKESTGVGLDAIISQLFDRRETKALREAAQQMGISVDELKRILH